MAQQATLAITQTNPAYPPTVFKQFSSSEPATRSPICQSNAYIPVY